MKLGRFHGRTSYAWNGEEQTRGRQVFHRATERFMRSERHFFATVNYVNNNPVHHGYVRLWTEWPWSSAAEYLAQTGRAEAERVWKEYPTPAFITRYIVGQALGDVLKQRFETLRQQHEAEAAGTARKALADPNAYDLTALNEPRSEERRVGKE